MREASHGARKVFESRGLHGQEQRVERIKELAALLWDEIDVSVPRDHEEAGRLVALAKTDLESSVMWAVKAISRFDVLEIGQQPSG